jgi:hypothetical protein
LYLHASGSSLHLNSGYLEGDTKMPNCTVCWDLIDDETRPGFNPDSRSLKIRIADLLKSIERGCPACTLLLNGSKCFVKQTDFIDLELDYQYMSVEPTSTSELAVLVRDGVEKGMRYIRLEFFMSQGQYCL